MESQRHIGIDLHRNQFTCCVRLENGRNYLTDWKLEDLPRFVKKLRPSDEIAVEVTGNTRLFHEAVAPYVKRVVAVDPNQFQVISHSVKKTDPNDARNLALYLEKDLLPEVRMKDQTQAHHGSPTASTTCARSGTCFRDGQASRMPALCALSTQSAPQLRSRPPGSPCEPRQAFVAGFTTYDIRRRQKWRNGECPRARGWRSWVT